ncbi:hypothetical protein ACOMHN_039427 [Nucella lapillus]
MKVVARPPGQARAPEVLAGLLLFLALPCGMLGTKPSRPNILYILADDLGWHDVGWPSLADMDTPNLNKLKKKGLELTQFYTQPKCTASRAALMTGRYPYKMGLQTHKVFTRTKNNTLPLQYKLLPAYLKDLGYHTHMVGKWHLGNCKVNATPIKRGFDTQFGSFGNLKNRFNLTTRGNLFDWTWNNQPYWQGQGTYSTHLITNHTQFLLKQHFTNDSTKDQPIFLYVPFTVPHEPNDVPERYITQTNCSYIPKYFTNSSNVHNNRRDFCGMMAVLDEAVGNITRTLRQLKVTKKFITIFTSDNGATVRSGGSSWPLRGSKQTVYEVRDASNWPLKVNKQTVYEGGTRVRTLLYAPKYLPKRKRRGVYNGLIHVTDVLPTLLEAANGNLSVLPDDLDGMSAWSSIREGKATRRQWMVYNIDSARSLGGLRFKNATLDLKLIYSNATTTEPGHRSQDLRPKSEQEKDPLMRKYRRRDVAYFLYDLAKNPNERPPLKDGRFKDAAKIYPTMFEDMKTELKRLTEGEVDVPYYADLGNDRQNAGAVAVGSCE